MDQTQKMPSKATISGARNGLMIGSTLAILHMPLSHCLHGRILSICYSPDTLGIVENAHCFVLFWQLP